MKIAVFYENLLTACEKEGIMLLEALKLLKEKGLEAVYIEGSNYKRDKEMLSELLPKTGLFIAGMHQHFDFSHNREDESFKEFIDLAKASGADNILPVPGFIPEGEDREALLSNMLFCMERAVRYGKEQGVYVCMEDYDNLYSPINSVKGMDFFFERIPDLKCAYDSGNFCTYNEDSVAALKHFIQRTVLVHIKDRDVSFREGCGKPYISADGTPYYCVPSGTGIMRIREIVNILKENNFDGTLVAELYGYEDTWNGLLKSVENLKEFIGK